MSFSDQHTTEKFRTTIMLPVSLIDEIDKICFELGVSRSSFIAMGSAFFTARSSDVLKPTERKKTLEAIEDIFLQTLNEAKKSL